MRRLFLFLLVGLLLFGVGVWAGMRIGRALNPTDESVLPAFKGSSARYLGKPLPPSSAKLTPADITTALQRFTEVWYTCGTTWQFNKWLGIPALQNPMDTWVTQEIICEEKPDFVIDCGTYHGGSAAFWALVLSQVNPSARVITIDIKDMMDEARKVPIVKEKVDFLLGSSTAPEIVNEIAKRVEGKKVIVVLDSLHTKEHVLQELEMYSPMIKPGGYIIVQDTVVNGHPVKPDFGPGPFEAVQEFLAHNPGWAADSGRERLLFTFCPGGFLKRVK